MRRSSHGAGIASPDTLLAVASPAHSRTQLEHHAMAHSVTCSAAQRLGAASPCPRSSHAQRLPPSRALSFPASPSWTSASTTYSGGQQAVEAPSCPWPRLQSPPPTAQSEAQAQPRGIWAFLTGASNQVRGQAGLWRVCLPARRGRRLGAGRVLAARPPALRGPCKPRVVWSPAPVPASARGVLLRPGNERMPGVPAPGPPASLADALLLPRPLLPPQADAPQAESALPPEVERLMRFTDAPQPGAEEEEAQGVLSWWRYQGLK